MKKDVVIIYRDNDLFSTWIGKVVETIKSLGCIVEVKSFPKSTDKKEIEVWILENKEDIKGKICLSDNTCSLYRFYSNEEIQGLCEEVKFRNLDDLFQKATAEAVIGDDKYFVVNGGEPEMEKLLFKQLEGATYKIVCNEMQEMRVRAADHSIPLIVRRIVEKSGIPSQISINASQYLLSHEPFSSYYGFIPVEKEKLSPEELQDAIERAVTRIKVWLIAGGIPEEKIFVNDSELDRVGNWIIHDRHDHIKLSHAISLSLPLPNFFQDAVENNLLHAPKEKFEKKLENNLRKLILKCTVP